MTRRVGPFSFFSDRKSSKKKKVVSGWSPFTLLNWKICKEEQREQPACVRVQQPRILAARLR